MKFIQDPATKAWQFVVPAEPPLAVRSAALQVPRQAPAFSPTPVMAPDSQPQVPKYAASPVQIIERESSFTWPQLPQYASPLAQVPQCASPLVQVPQYVASKQILGRSTAQVLGAPGSQAQLPQYVEQQTRFHFEADSQPQVRQNDAQPSGEDSSSHVTRSRAAAKPQAKNRRRSNSPCRVWGSCT